jgi:hypothetical protein
MGEQGYYRPGVAPWSGRCDFLTVTGGGKTQGPAGFPAHFSKLLNRLPQSDSGRVTTATSMSVCFPWRWSDASQLTDQIGPGYLSRRVKPRQVCWFARHLAGYARSCWSPGPPAAQIRTTSLNWAIANGPFEGRTRRPRHGLNGLTTALGFQKLPRARGRRIHKPLLMSLASTRFR